MVVPGCQENKSCSKVLNFLERLDDRIRCTHEETVAVVKPLEDIGKTGSIVDTTTLCTGEITLVKQDPSWIPQRYVLVKSHWRNKIHRGYHNVMYW